jgi:hypothetical protein
MRCRRGATHNDKDKIMAELNNTPKPRMKGSEVAACLRVTMQTVRMYESQGKLHPVWLNARKKLYDPDEVERLLAGSTATVATSTP